jgi:hypothetical protein
VSELREKLESSPLEAGDITIDTIYRQFDKKPIETNYIEIGYMGLYSKQGHAGDSEEVRVWFDVISTNEIMVERLANEFKTKYLDGLRVTDEFKIPLKTYYDMGIAKINTSRYTRRISADVTVSNCFIKE